MQVNTSIPTILGWVTTNKTMHSAPIHNSLPPINTVREFMGYQRPDGEVGTRNYLGILTSVNCSGSVARFIAESAEKCDWFLQSVNIDGIVPIVHGTGCGMSKQT